MYTSKASRDCAQTVHVHIKHLKISHYHITNKFIFTLSFHTMKKALVDFHQSNTVTGYPGVACVGTDLMPPSPVPHLELVQIVPTLLLISLFPESCCCTSK